jgi:hypothetical protein
MPANIGEADQARRTAPARPCPFCSSEMRAEIALCPSCGRFSRPIRSTAAQAENRGVLEWLNAAIARWEGAHPGLRNVGSQLTFPAVQIPRIVVITVAAACLLLGLAMAVLWLRYGGWPQSSTALALWIVASALFVGRPLIRSTPVIAPAEKPANDVSLHALGYDVNLAFIQCASVLVMVICAVQGFLDQAWHAGLVALALTPLLLRTTAIVRSIAFGTSALFWLVYQWVSVQSYGYDAEITQRVIFWGSFWADRWPPVAPYVWLLLAVAAVPQLQLPNLGGAGFGRFAGDFATRAFEGKMPVSLMSSLILVSAWRAGWALVYSPVWLPHALYG